MAITILDGDYVTYRFSNGEDTIAIVQDTATGSLRTIANNTDDDVPIGPQPGGAWSFVPTPATFTATALPGGARPAGIAYLAYLAACGNDVPLDLFRFDQTFWQTESDPSSLNFGELSRSGAPVRETTAQFPFPRRPESITIDLIDDATIGFSIQVKFRGIDGSVYAPAETQVSDTNGEGTPGTRREIVLDTSELDITKFPSLGSITFETISGGNHSQTVHRVWSTYE